MRIRPLFVLCAVLTAMAAAAPASAQGTTDQWSQFQGGPGRDGDASSAPAPPYGVSWQAAAGIGDPSHLSGYPTPVIAGSLAFVVGPQEVTVVRASDGTAAFSVPRLLGPSSPPAVVGTTLLFLEGGGDESALASSSPSPSPTSSPSASASPAGTPRPAGTPSQDPTKSSLVALDLTNQKRLWTAPLSDVSHTGVLALGDVAVVGADDGQVSAFSIADGTPVWSIDAGDQVVAPLAGSSDLVLASVRPDTGGTPSLLAVHLADGSQAWRYPPPKSVLDLGGPSVAGDTAYVVASDASLRALSLADGSLRWASPLYTPTVASPPVVTDAGVFVTDQSGTVYSFDPATGVERWRFATNHTIVGAPIATSTTVLQPTLDGSVIGIDIGTGHQVWQRSIADNAALGLAASSSAILVSHTGSAPGLVALVNDPAGTLEDVTSPTTGDPAALIAWWLLAALPIAVILVLLGGWLDRRMGPADLGVPDDVVDPWEADLEDEP